MVFRTSADGARVERRLVRLGRIKGGQVEVAAGLAPGDTVVVRGHSGLVDGAAIQARNADGTAK